MNVNRDEQRAAEELDALLTARLARQEPPSPSELSETEAAFASALVESAEATQPAPGFVANLTVQLERASRNPGQIRRSFLQNFSARRQTMFKRMTIALTGAVALAVAIFIVLPLLNSQQNLPPLPSLAMMRAYAQSGGTTGSSVFPGTTFVLSTTLPTSPNRIAVYRRSEANPITLDEFRYLAERFGLRGPIYLPGSSVQTLIGFAIFDGTRQLKMMGDMAVYSDTALQKIFPAEPPISFQQAAGYAKDFLQTHGLLDLPYRVEASRDTPSGVVRFVRLLNDSPIQNGEIKVTVTSKGQIASASFRPLALERVGDYPIRSAQAAWEQLTSGQISDRIQYSIRRYELSGSPAQSHFWYPQYRPGQRVDLYGSITVYIPAEGKGSSLILLNDYELHGKTQGLDRVATAHIWGTLESDGRSIEVNGWYEDPAPLFSPFQGTIQREGNLVLLRREDGKTFALPNAPDDLPDGITVTGGGRETNRTEGNYPVLDWASVMSPPSALPRTSQMDSMPSFQGSVVVVPVQPITPSAQSSSGPTPVVPPPLGQSGPASGGGYAPPILLPTPPLASGQRVEGLAGWLQATILESADGKTRTLNANLAEMPLSKEPGWAAKLTGAGIEGIGQYDRLRVRVWGRFSIQDEQPTITVERYEKAVPDERIQAWLGREEDATVEGRQVTLFQTRDGQRYILASSFRPSPPPPTIGRQVLLEGVLRQETFGGYSVIEQISIRWDDRIGALTDLGSYQLESRPQVIGRRQPMPGKAYVERVELIYYAIANPLMGFSSPPIPDASLRVVQPLWKFTGHTEDGTSFEILVQAVSDQYLK